MITDIKNSKGEKTHLKKLAAIAAKLKKTIRQKERESSSSGARGWKDPEEEEATEEAAEEEEDPANGLTVHLGPRYPPKR